MKYARKLEWKDEVVVTLKRKIVLASQNVAHLVQKIEGMKLALMVVTKENEAWDVKYETHVNQKDGKFKGVVFQRQWEDNHVKLTHLQGEAIVANEEVLEKLERNSATLSIMGWWLCIKAKMQCKFEEKMRADMIVAGVGELQSRDTLVVSL